MEEPGSLLPLLLTVTAISLSGTIAPGPVTAVTVTKGAVRKEAGALVALGHGIVEFPMIALLALGFATVMAVPGVKAAVGLAGGSALIWMGVGTLRTKPGAFDDRREVSKGCLLAGVTATAANPYWFVWWVTVGAVLVLRAGAWGLLGIAAFAVTHWLCDLGWLWFLSWGVFTSKRFWTPGVYRGVLIVSAAVLAGFGAWFIISGISLLI
jgi:threonine/homoserine/homoserine lactone efflux protein